ncbi:hypothetical protein [Pararhodospirillum photometricum]|nr:hypothetical protein [Pararhodospirillum photometricum]
MIRAVLALLVPVLVPWVGWVLWAEVARRRGRPRPEVPVVALVVTAMALMLLGAGVLAFMSADGGEPPGTSYTPPRALDVNPEAWPVTPRP